MCVNCVFYTNYKIKRILERKHVHVDIHINIYFSFKFPNYTAYSSIFPSFPVRRVGTDSEHHPHTQDRSHHHHPRAGFVRDPTFRLIPGTTSMVDRYTIAPSPVCSMGCRIECVRERERERTKQRSENRCSTLDRPVLRTHVSE